MAGSQAQQGDESRQKERRLASEFPGYVVLEEYRGLVRTLKQAVQYVRLKMSVCDIQQDWSNKRIVEPVV